MKKIFPTIFLGGFLLLCATGVFSIEEKTSPVIRMVRVADVISPTIADFIVKELEKANAADLRAFLIELDTPGGLDTAMRTIIQGILGSRIPVIVYVYPSGARAASAGALITLASDFAVMAPGTNIGAATPVSIGVGGGEEETDKKSDMKKKVIEDASAYARSLAEQRGRNTDWAERIVREATSTSAEEALKVEVIDFIAEDEQALLQKLDGRSYVRKGEKKLLQTDGVVLEQVEMGWRQEILNTISNPNIAYLLMMLGILGIFFEISQPGVIFPGAIGALALLLAFFAFQTLPVNWVGALLILLAFILFLLEIAVPSFGMLTVGGIISLTLGSMMLIETSEPYMQISRAVIAGTVAAASCLIILVLFFVVRTQRGRFFSGYEGMVGELGEAVTAIDRKGRVFVHGEYWDSFSAEPISAGETVEVVRLGENLRMEVKKADREKH